MRNSILVGAVGLALTSVAFASDDAKRTQTVRPPADTSTFVRLRDAALGAPGTTQRETVLGQLRHDIAVGAVDPRRVLFAITEDLIPGSGNVPNIGANASASTEGALGANAPFFDDFSTYVLTDYSNVPTSLVPLKGQTNPAGFVWGGGGADDWFGVATDAIMTNIGVGEPGGMAPLSQPEGGEPYGALARRTGQDALTTAFALAFNQSHMIFAPGQDPVEGHSRLSTDWYLKDSTTSQWWSPVSFLEGFVQDRVFFGGSQIGFGFEGPSGILDTFASLGVLAGNFTIGQFYAPPSNPNFPFPVDKWFRMMSFMGQGAGGGLGYGLFVKTPDTIANNFLDPSMASGDIIPVDKEAAGWVNTYPGREDSALSLEREGVGFARTQFGTLAPTNGAFSLSTPLAAVSASGVQFGEGLDPPATVDPNFSANDAFIDNYIGKGTVFITPMPLPDFILPYTEDFEFYFLQTPLKIQTNRWFDALSSLAIIANSGGSKTLLQQNLNSGNIFRNENDTDVPVFPARVEATAADPLVTTVRIRMGGFPSVTGRAIRILDNINTGNLTSVILGATDPTEAFAASDNKVWVRQPNIGADGVWPPNPLNVNGFLDTEDAENNRVQADQIPELMWWFPPDDAPFNTTFINVPTNFTVPSNSFFTLNIQIKPNPNEDPANPFDQGLMRVAIGATVLRPNGATTGDPDGFDWLAGGINAGNIQIWSSNNGAGQFNTLNVDDIVFGGPLYVRPAGPPFSMPYVDDFSLYNVGPFDDQGDTPFLNGASLPDNNANDSARRLTLLNTPSSPSLVPGVSTVCRYEVLSTKLGSELLADGETVVVNFGVVPLPFDTITLPFDCPGVSSTAGGSFVIRQYIPGNLVASDNTPRVEEGFWRFLDPDTMTAGNQTSIYDPVANPNDNTSFSYSFSTLDRWGATGVVAEIKPGPTEGPGDNAIELEATFTVDGSLTDNPLTTILVSTLPEFSAGPSTNVTMSFDLYIESVNPDGIPNDALAPRSRMAIPIVGGGPNGGRITTLMFGGPNVNNITGLLGDPQTPVLADDLISVERPNPALLPAPADVFFESTGVSLFSGGANGGALLNTWFRVVFTLKGDSTWDFEIDPDRGGPAAASLIATGTAIDAGIADAPTNSTDSFNAALGLDLGSSNDPVPAPIRVRTMLPGPSLSNWDSIGPSGADADDDYCFYEITLNETGASVTNRVQIAEVSDDQVGLVESVRDLAAGQQSDIVAVVNRRIDANNAVIGPKIHADCPFSISSGINKVEIFDGDPASLGFGTLMFSGRWFLDRQVGNSGINNPGPAGGINRPNGPAVQGGDMVSNSYNNPMGVQGFPADPVAREIVLASFGQNEADLDATGGVPGFPNVSPTSRWFIDNLSIEEGAGPPPCLSLAPPTNSVDGADVATLLSNWGPSSSAADFNGDGVVNGADFATLLANWGPCQQ